MSEEPILSKVLRDLHNPSREVRFAAINMLNQVGDEKSIDLLLKALNDESWHLRERAAEILGTKGKQAVIPLMNSLLEGVWYVRAASAMALGNIGLPIAITALADFWSDQNETVRKNVQEAFIKIIETNSTESIAGVLSIEEEETVENVMVIITEIQPELVAEIREVLQNPELIDEEFIPQKERYITEEERGKLLHDLRKRLRLVGTA